MLDAPLATIRDLLTLRSLGDDRFVTVAPPQIANARVSSEDRRMPEQRSRVFGGQLISQALVAASHTVIGCQPHSLHAYFVAEPVAAEPIEYVVRRLRDGRNISNRVIEASQGGRALLTLSASFDAGALDGPEHQDPVPPRVPPPEVLATENGAESFWASSVEMRLVRRTGSGRESTHVASRLLWLRVSESLPEDPKLHACALGYLSDLGLLRTFLAAHANLLTESRRVTLASIDHAVWFHRPARADEWLLYASVAPTAIGGRTLALGHLFTRKGQLVATVAQEGAVRLGDDEG